MGDLVLFLPFLALFGVIIYMQTRQRKKIQARQADLQAALSVGAPILLTCGLYGDVAGLDDATVDVEIAPGVVSRFARAAVLEVRTEDKAPDIADSDTDSEIDTEVDTDTDTGADTGTRTGPGTGTPTSRPTKPLARDDPSA
ncbi:MAG: preprotein translocase subunit YajC [Actinomycetota bacterium]|nr:preprotein translocase subunit YajC [Actinomycetota bacterium]